ncbi:MAG: SRPBCC domain-containing protein [Pseudomonadota bacterium]|nr:SRPBCC domain-containing protein [Pseudomonadota bacterium]
MVRWWGSDEAYRWTGWTTDVRVGGRWRAEGRGCDGQPLAVEGEFLEVDPPHKLVQTWKPNRLEGQVTTLTYRLEATAEGTRLIVRHEGFAGQPDACRLHGDGWVRVLGWLERHILPEPGGEASRVFLCRLLPPRPTFAQDMTAEEAAVMREHAAYWGKHLHKGTAIVFGQVADPKGAWGNGHCPGGR